MNSALRGATWKIRMFGWLKIPLLAYVRPSVIALDARQVVVRIPLRRRTKNHLGCMYFGALSIGADIAGGLLAMEQIEASREDVSLIFKDFRADFLKRAEGDVLFTCTEGETIRALVDEAVAGENRVEMPVHVTATVPDLLGDEPVAEFILTLSLKKRSGERDG